MTIHDHYWLFMPIHDSSWPFVRILDIFDQIIYNPWQVVKIQNISWRFMTVHENSWQFMSHDFVAYWSTLVHNNQVICTALSSHFTRVLTSTLLQPVPHTRRENINKLDITFPKLHNKTHEITSLHWPNTQEDCISLKLPNTQQKNTWEHFTALLHTPQLKD